MTVLCRGRLANFMKILVQSPALLNGLCDHKVAGSLPSQYHHLRAVKALFPKQKISPEFPLGAGTPKKLLYGFQSVAREEGFVKIFSALVLKPKDPRMGGTGVAYEAPPSTGLNPTAELRKGTA
jgi:hypothetical protein